MIRFKNYTKYFKPEHLQKLKLRGMQADLKSGVRVDSVCGRWEVNYGLALFGISPSHAEAVVGHRIISLQLIH